MGTKPGPVQLAVQSYLLVGIDQLLRAGMMPKRASMRRLLLLLAAHIW
jgi:hypothetical protein